MCFLLEKKKTKENKFQIKKEKKKIRILMHQTSLTAAIPNRGHRRASKY